MAQFAGSACPVGNQLRSKSGQILRIRQISVQITRKQPQSQSRLVHNNNVFKNLQFTRSFAPRTRLGSASMTVTAAPFRASSEASRMAEVDFPAPPLGLAKT